MDWKATVETLLEHRRERLGGPLSLEEVSRLHDAATGEARLDPEERSRLLERLGADPEAAQQLLALLRFGDGVEEPDAEGGVEDEEAERWQRFRVRLAEEGELPAAEPEAPLSEAAAVPEPLSHAGPPTRRFLPLAASFVLGALLVLLGGELWKPSRQTTAVPKNLPIVELVDDGSGVTRADGVVRLPFSAGGLVLTLAPGGLRGLGPGAEISLSVGPGGDASAEPHRIPGLEPGPGGVFVLTLPRALLADGENRLALEADGEEVAVFLLELEMESPPAR